MLICAGWLPPYLCTPRRDLSLGTCIRVWLLTPNRALNVFEDASHRGGVLTRKPEGCDVLLRRYTSCCWFVRVNSLFPSMRALDLIGDGPHKATEFPCQRHHRDIMRFAFALHVLIALAQAQLCPPGNIAHG